MEIDAWVVGSRPRDQTANFTPTHHCKHKGGIGLGIGSMCSEWTTFKSGGKGGKRRGGGGERKKGGDGQRGTTNELSRSHDTPYTTNGDTNRTRKRKTGGKN